MYSIYLYIFLHSKCLLQYYLLNSFPVHADIFKAILLLERAIQRNIYCEQNSCFILKRECEMWYLPFHNCIPAEKITAGENFRTLEWTTSYGMMSNLHEISVHYFELETSVMFWKTGAHLSIQIIHWPLNPTLSMKHMMRCFRNAPCDIETDWTCLLKWWQQNTNLFFSPLR